MTKENTRRSKYRGVAMITSVPFDDRGRVDAAGYRRVVEHQINAGIAMVQCPLADELYYCSDEENALVMKTLADTCRGRAVSCAIASHTPNVARIVANAQLYESLGIDVIKVLSPLHFGMDFTPEDIYAYYAQITQAVKAPIMIYNQPRRAGVNVPPAVIARLVKDYPQIALLEETNFNQLAEVKALTGDALSVYVKFPFWLPATTLGCDGMYSWLPYAPAEVQELSALCLAGNIDEARTLFYQRFELYSLTDFLSVPALKFGLSEIGFSMGGVRPPVPLKMPDALEAQFRAAIGKHVKRRTGPAH
jgi:4-hydroxy-tetrahydrodipicolinate synthase